MARKNNKRKAKERHRKALEADKKANAKFEKNLKETLE
jgi:hypothetical protein